MSRHKNRKLLTSVYSAQEAREAMLGGARIIDSEDPRSALGNISPLRIMAIANATLDYKRDLEVQLSTNIGEDQLIFERTESGAAVEKSLLETAGKAAQAALGVALSMGTEVHPCNIVKVGLDNMPAAQLSEVLDEVVRTLRRSPALRTCQVMSVLFAHDITLWNERNGEESVRTELINLREFGPVAADAEGALDLRKYYEGFLNADGKQIFERSSDVTLKSLQEHRILPRSATSTWVKLNEPHANWRYFGGPEKERTTKEVIRKMVDITADAGADAMMLDTSILSKVCNIGLVNAHSEGFVNLSQYIVRKKLTQRGVLTLDEIKFFVEYCHYRGIAANLAGSIESFQAQQLWAYIPALDQISTRGAASAVATDPFTGNTSADSRQRRTIVRQLVRGLAPPEGGGVLNIPEDVEADGHSDVLQLCRELSAQRRRDGDPELEAFYVSKDGKATAISPSAWRVNSGT
jgi:uncharacterized protein (UPF0264 family)